MLAFLFIGIDLLLEILIEIRYVLLTVFAHVLDSLHHFLLEPALALLNEVFNDSRMGDCDLGFFVLARGENVVVGSVLT